MAHKFDPAASKFFRNYAHWTPTTSIHKSDKDAATACILGIGGELNEYFESIYQDREEGEEESGDELIQKELGDVLYYMGLLAIKLDFIDYVELEDAGDGVILEGVWTTIVFKMQEQYKKMIRDNDGKLNGFKGKSVFISDYIDLLSLLYSEARRNKWDWSGILAANQEKLMSRLNRGKIGGSGDVR